MTNSKKGSKSSNKSIDEERKKARETKLQNERKVEEDRRQASELKLNSIENYHPNSFNSNSKRRIK